MSRCATCGTDLAPIRVDGDCFRCHVRGIGFTYKGGAHYGRAGWNVTEREHLEEHVGFRAIRDGDVERAS